MLIIKFICVIVICFSSWILGKMYAETLKNKICMVEKYIILLKEIKSNVSYSGKNLYDFLGVKSYDKTNRFCTFLLQNKEKGLEKAVQTYSPINEEEKFCVESMFEAFAFLENSSDTESISDMISCTTDKLTEYKKQLGEEYKGKIKTSPPIFLLCGLFIALVLI